MIDNLTTSQEWQIQENETAEVFTLRKELQLKTWYEIVRKHGHLYMVKFGEDDIRPMWENKINVPELVKSIPSPALIPHDCPLCQPYDYFDIHTGQYVQRRHLTKIVHPKYPEGFIDRGGVWVKCVCILKGEDRKYLKFQGMKNV